jgi:group I intron endonuclease
MSIGIYKITSPSDKIYIGQSNNIENRFKQYSKFKNIKNQIGLYNSFLKYGYINHKLEVVEECKIEDLNIRERYWQEHYNVLEEGLNCVLTSTEVLPRVLSLESKEKISLSKKGKKFSKKTCNLISKNKTGVFHKLTLKAQKQIINLYENHSINYISNILGISFPTIINFLKKEKIYRKYKHKPPILQLSLNNELIKEWDSIAEACISLKLIGKNGDIQSCCNKKQKTAFGFKWNYKIK